MNEGRSRGFNGRDQVTRTRQYAGTACSTELFSKLFVTKRTHMNKHRIGYLGLMLIFLSIIISSFNCTNGQSQRREFPFKKVEKPIKLNIQWTRLAAPFPVSLIFLVGSEVTVAGESGWAKITESEFDVHPIKIAKEFEFTDQQNWRPIAPLPRFPGDEKPFPYVCTPKKLINAADPTVIFAECEHGSQIWMMTDHS